MTYEEFIQEWNNSLPTIQVHTSGSTGTPKQMHADKQKMLASARITCDYLGLRKGDTALLCMSLDYIAGKMMAVRAIERGLQLIQVPPSGHPLADVAEPIDFAAMVPLQVFNSLQVPEERAKLRQIRHLIIGGGAIDDALAAELREFPNAVWSTYGMTETLSHIALRRLNGPEATDFYTPFDTVSVSINTDGCLVIDAPEVCDHPLVTNDLAELLPSLEGVGGEFPSFRILGRRDNTINTGGVKVQIEEVERLLRPHLHDPYMITRRKDTKFGEVIVLMIEEKASASDPAEWKNGREKYLSDILHRCQQVLPPYWAPREILTVKQLPMTENGKPNRAEAERITSLSGKNGGPSRALS